MICWEEVFKTSDSRWGGKVQGSKFKVQGSKFKVSIIRFIDLSKKPHNILLVVVMEEYCWMLGIVLLVVGWQVR